MSPCPSKTRTGSPRSTSQTRTVLSEPADATCRPSGRERHGPHPVGVPAEHAARPAAGQVPEPDRPVEARAGQQRAVGTDGHGRHE